MKKIVFIILLLTLHNCNKSSNQENRPKDVDFNIDYSFLGEIYNFSDNLTSFNPPKDWVRQKEDDIVMYNKKLASDDNVIQLTLEDAFSSTLGSHVLISKINSEEIDFNFLPNDFLRLLEEQFHLNKIIFHTIIINNLVVKQYKIENDDVIIFKNFISKKDDSSISYEVDYIISKLHYNSEIKSIESSIGTLKRKG